jgi:ELWxxDGT repeat protein
MVAVSGVLFTSLNDGFSTGGKHGSELWRSDSTTAGTTLIKDIHPGTSSGVNLNLTNNRVNLAGNLLEPVSKPP